MDTTIRNLDGAACRPLRARAALTGKTVGELVTEAIRAYLARPTALTKRGSLRDLRPEHVGPGPTLPRGLTYTLAVCSVRLTVDGGQTAMHRRLNITLPEETVRLIDRVAAKGDRSRFIAEAVTHYVAATGRARLRKRLKEGATRRAERDRRLARDWFVLDEEAWQTGGR